MSNVNFIHAYGNVYVVRNQNGFNAALYDEFGCREDGTSLYTKSEIRDMVESYPKKYPSVVSLMGEMFECHRIYVTVLGIGDLVLMKEKIDESLNAHFKYTFQRESHT